MIGAGAAALAGLWWAATIAYQVAAQLALAAQLRRRPEPAEADLLPSCTVLRPLCGVGPRTEPLLRQVCALGAPVVVGAEKGEDDTVKMAHRVREDYPEGRLSIVEGHGPTGGNLKVANLIRMLPAAHGDVLVFTDDDISVPPEYLEAVLAPFADPKVGLVTCPYRSVAGPSVKERVDVLLTNAGFLPSVALARLVEGVRFGLGATIAVRRAALEQIGGLESLLDLLADDHAMADKTRRAGWGLVLAPILLDHDVSTDREWRWMLRRHVRWARTTRVVRPGGYAGFVVAYGLAASAALWLAAGAAWGAPALALWLAVRVGGFARLREPLGLTARDLALLPLADAIAFGVFLAGCWSKSVWWGSRRLRLGSGGVILPTPARR